MRISVVCCVGINKISLSSVRLGLLPTINCQRREDTDKTQYNVDIVQCDYLKIITSSSM